MGTPEIVPRAFFSLREDVKNNAHYISDFQILYPAGSVLILHNYYEKRQRYIKLGEKCIFLEKIIISNSRKLAAIIQNGEKGQIVIFDLGTLKRKRILNLPPDSTSTRFETISFTHDDIYIIAITGEPDWFMVTYKWEKGKVTSVAKATYPNNPGVVTQVCCSPTDSTEICLIGPGLFRLLTLNETVWRQYGFQKADQINITSATWLSSDKIICGTSEGKIFFIDNGDLKAVYSAITTSVINIKEKDEANTLTSSSLVIIKTIPEGLENDDLSVRALISFPKGFAYSCKIGRVHVFERQSENKFKKRNVFKIPDIYVEDPQNTELNIVKHLSINVSQDRLLATTSRTQIYSARLWGPDINVAPEIPFKHLGEPLHHGAILDMSMCVWKPIFATIGKIDQTIRIWNYETENLLLVKYFPEKLFCLDLHPMGNFVAIGFRDRVEICVILLNDIQFFRTLNVRDCDKCVYSLQGNYIAAVNNGAIDIYETILMKQNFTLKKHSGKINALHWSHDDKKLASCDSEGLICIWDTSSGTLLKEYETAGINYSDIAMTADGKFLYTVGNDGCLKEITEDFLARSIQFKHREPPHQQIIMQKISFSRSNLMMFLVGDDRLVLSVRVPLTIPPEFTWAHYHGARINKIQLSFDDQTLVTVSEGGSIIIWKINFTEGKTIAMDKNFIYSTEVLINKEELEKKILTIQSLSQKLYELEMGQAREMRDTETRYIEKIKEIHETFNTVIEEIQEKVEQTEADQKNQLLEKKEEIEELKAKQKKEKRDLIENYTKKLTVEYGKVESLDTSKEEMIKDFEQRVAELEKSKEDETNEIIRIYEEKLKDVDNLLQETYNENVENLKEHDKVKVNLEEDADREIVELKAKYEGVLREEKEQNAIHKDEAIAMRKKFSEATKERDEFREKEESLKIEQQKYQANIVALEKDIADLKAEIVERDTAIEEKDERIFLLKKKIQELDKFKFVLDYKVKELKKQIDPKDREIRERKEQIADMEVELGNLKKLNSSLELQLIELREKIVGTEKEVNSYEKKHLMGVNTLRQIKVDIFSLYQELNDYKKLKDGIKALYHKYYQEELENVEHFGESDRQRELMLQREFLEKTIIALKSTLRKNLQKKGEKNKVLQDNVVLLEELNQIRKDLKEAVFSVRRLEKLIGLRGAKSMVPSEAFKKMEQALKKQENIKQIYQEVIDEAEEETLELNQKVKQMREKLLDLLENENA